MGKSSLAVHLAGSFDGEIVNADSRQVYRFMDIGTAKPFLEDRAKVRHHLIDVLDPDQEFSLAMFLELARQSIQDIHNRDKLPIVAGGTGQYIWALLEGWQVPHVPPDPELRQELEEEARQEGAGTLHQRLREIDPETASRTDPRNVRRVIRALEIYYATDAPPSTFRSKKPPPYHPFILGLTADRETLYRSIDHRVEEMLEKGLTGEVADLLRMGYSSELPSMSSMGYKEIALYLRGEFTLEKAAQRIKYETHRFARHQYAWFRLRDPRIHWLQFGHDANFQAGALVGAFLSCVKIASATGEMFK